jgi:hypothetical protein
MNAKKASSAPFQLLKRHLFAIFFLNIPTCIRILLVCSAFVVPFGRAVFAQSVPATLTPVSGSGQSTTVNTTFSNPLKVLVQDANSNLLNNVAVTFTAPSGSPTSTTSAQFNGVSNTITVYSDSTGYATVPASSVTASQKAGQYNVSVTAGAASTTILLINAAGSPGNISVSQGAGQQAAILTTLPTNFVALLVDGFGNPTPGVSVTFTAPSSGASGTFSGLSTALTTTDANGLATSPAFTLNAVSGTFNVTANTTASPLGQPANFNLVSLPGSANQISLYQGAPQSAQILSAFGTLLKVLVKDSNNNPVPNVSVTFTAPVSGATATFSGGASVTVSTDASGIATSSTLTANSITGSYNITASYSGGSTVSFALTNTPGSAANISVNGGGSQQTTVTLAFGSSLSVMVTDSNNNPVSGQLVTFTSPSQLGASAVLSSGTGTTNSSGIASVTATANSTAGNYTVTASAAGVGSTASFDMTNINPSAIAVQAGDSQSTSINTNFATQLAVKVTNGTGTGIQGLVVTFTAPSSGASGTFSGSAVTTTATTNSSGIATATTIKANGTTGAFVVNATVAGIATPTIFNLTNLAAAANSITINQGNSQSTAINSDFTTSLRVQVYDINNNLLGNYPVTFTVNPVSGAGATFSGSATTYSVNTSSSGSKYATAATLTGNNTAGSYTVTVTAGSVTQTFTLTNLAPATITASGGRITGHVHKYSVWQRAPSHR